MNDDEASLKARSQIRGPSQNPVAAGIQVDSTDDYLGYRRDRCVRVRYVRTCPNRTIDILKDLCGYRIQKEPPNCVTTMCRHHDQSDSLRGAICRNDLGRVPFGDYALHRHAPEFV